MNSPSTAPTVRKTILAARNLEKGDQIFSKSSGKYLTVSKVENKVNRTVVLLDGDMEIDFEAYYQLDVWRTKK